MSRGAPAIDRLVVGLAGPRLAATERAWLVAHRPAGVILFRHNVRDAGQVATLCRQVREVLPAHAEIMADHEGGPVSVLDAAAGRPPAPWALGVIDDPDLTREVMHAAAAAARALGVDRLLAPCMDVMTEPRNPIIGARAFGADPQRVARHVAAAVAGIVGAGMRCCLKHWPGHGGTGVDTHIGDAGTVVPEDPAALRAGLAAGADAVMLGHLRLPGDDLPASISPAATDRLRRTAAGARLVSDDLTMGALRGPLGARAGLDLAGEGLCDPSALPRVWFEAAAAGGCDILLCCGIPWTAWPLADGDDAEPPRREATPPVARTVASSPSWTAAAARSAEPCLDPARGDLLCWHASPTHHWGPLDADDIRAAGWTGGLADLDDRRDGPWEQLLITSHVPLGEADLRAARSRLSGALSAAGVCLTLGHPSLAADAADLLPAGWRVCSGFDLSGEVLSPFITRRANS
ncbi:glycoside hydrolase family 3 protein [bacterium]|nr:glycoside hydrolase family 3 protein [bacterium]